MRPGVVDLEAEAVTALLPKPSLEAVVGGGGPGGLLLDVANAGISASHDALDSRGRRITWVCFIARAIRAELHRRVQRVFVDRRNHALVPSDVAHILRNQNQRRNDFVLDAQTELSYTRSGIVSRDRRHALRHNRQSRRGECCSKLPISEWVVERGIGDSRCIGERNSIGKTERVIALHALKEGAKAAAEHGFSVSSHVIREADARHVGLVEIIDHATRNPILARNGHTVHIEDTCREGLQAIRKRAATCCHAYR